MGQAASLSKALVYKAFQSLSNQDECACVYKIINVKYGYCTLLLIQYSP